MNATSRARLVVLISGRGSNLRSIVQAVEDGDLAADIAGVISNRPDAAGLAWAQAKGIPGVAVDHRCFGSREAFDTALGDAIEALAPLAPATPATPVSRTTATAGQGEAPWVVLAGFMRILGEAFTERFAGRLVNIHPSLLPAYPGLHTHQRALADGALLHGATIHLVTPALDHGPIVAQALVPVLASDDEAALAARVLAMEHRLYPLALDWLVRGRVSVDRGRVCIDGDDAPALRVLRHPLLVPVT